MAMRKTIRSASAALLLGVIALPLSSCGDLSKQTRLDVPEFTARHRPTLHEASFSREAPTEELDFDAVHAIGGQYGRTGEGPVSVSVTYDPKSRTNTASHATSEAARIAVTLHKSGVADVKTEVLPAAAKGGKSTTLISFRTLGVEAAEDCYMMGGVGRKPTGVDRDYPIGCTTETLMARQTAHPRDLQGKAGLDDGSGRRQYLVVEPYVEGKPNPPLTNTQSATSQ
jgi:type IV pilus biogenesis protein CpaD/CtpE